MQKFQQNIQDQFGNELNGNTITVRDVSGGGLSTIFSDNVATPLANPFIAQDGSEFFFYAANNRYDIFITGPVTDSFLDVILFDQAGTPASVPIDLADNVQIRFGNSQDLLMFFDSVNFVLNRITGDIEFQNLGSLFFVLDMINDRTVVYNPLFIQERTVANADTATFGQFWVRDDAPNTPMFTDDIGTDFVLNSPGTLQGVVDAGNTTTTDIEIITGAALTIFAADDLDSVSMEINTSTLSPAQAFVFLGSAAIEGYNFAEPVNIDGNSIHIGTLSRGVEFWRLGDAVSHSLSRESNGLFMQVVVGTFELQAQSLAIHDGASPGTNVAGIGQLWVRSSAPNRLTFTDDTDIDQLIDPSLSETISVVASRTNILTDKGKTTTFTGSTAAQTMTIPASGAVAYQIGTFLAWDNSGSVSFSIAITTDTLIFAADNSTGTRTLAAGGMAVAQKVGATTWKIAGSGLT